MVNSNFDIFKLVLMNFPTDFREKILLHESRRTEMNGVVAQDLLRCRWLLATTTALQIRKNWMLPVYQTSLKFHFLH